MNLKQELRDNLKLEVKDDSKTLRFYSQDASAFRLLPEMVVFPKNTSDLKGLVNFVRNRKASDSSISLTMRSAGTDMTGGPLNDSIIVDVNRYLTGLKKITNNSAVVEPGLFYRDLEKETLKRSLVFPSYPASKSLASVGGIVANNSGGEKSLRYGQTKDYVKKLKVILQDGNEYTFKKLTSSQLEKKIKQEDFEGKIYQKMSKLIKDNHELIQKSKPDVSKNSTGYLLWEIWDEQEDTFDLAKVFVGSQGTLGIITEATLGLVPVSKYSKMFVIYMRDISNLADVVNVILKFQPTSLELYDDKTLKLALKFAPQMARLIAKDQNIIRFGLQMLPDFWIMLTSGFPKLVLMVEISSDDEAKIDEQMRGLANALGSYKLKIHSTQSQAESKKYWTIRRQSFNLLRKKITNRQTVPFIDDLIVKPEKLPELLPKLNKILQQYPQLVYTIAGHAGNGNLHVIPLMDMADPAQRSLIPEISEKVYELVLKLGGSLSAEHNDGMIRGPYLKKMYGEEMLNIFKDVKKIFDPLGIFNPHKKTDADLQFSLAHLKKDNEHSV